MTSQPARLAYGVFEAAEATGLPVSTIRRALRATDPKAFPPPLAGKRAGNKLLVEVDELRRWVQSLPEVQGQR